MPSRVNSFTQSVPLGRVVAVVLEAETATLLPRSTSSSMTPSRPTPGAFSASGAFSAAAFSSAGLAAEAPLFGFAAGGAEDCVPYLAIAAARIAAICSGVCAAAFFFGAIAHRTQQCTSLAGAALGVHEPGWRTDHRLMSNGFETVLKPMKQSTYGREVDPVDPPHLGRVSRHSDGAGERPCVSHPD